MKQQNEIPEALCPLLSAPVKMTIPSSGLKVVSNTPQETVMIIGQPCFKEKCLWFNPFDDCCIIFSLYKKIKELTDETNSPDDEPDSLTAPDLQVK